MFRPVFILLAGVVVIAVAIAISFFSFRREQQPPVPPSVASAESPARPQAPQPEQPSPIPRFDVVRIDPTGHAVIAGRSLPGAQVTILDGGKPLGKVTGDTKGEWVYLSDGALPPGNRELSLAAVNPDGTVVESQTPVVLAVPPRGPGNNGPALAFKIEPNGAVTMMQGPEAGPGAGAISIQSVATDDKSQLAISGKSSPQAKVHLFVDDVLFGETTADERGSWQVAGVNTLAAGAHSVRADQMAADGRVAARAEVQYQAEGSASQLADAGGGAPGSRTQIIVTPGTNLWRIARQAYGKGFQYVMIFQANQGQIRNPNLIFPGQVFRVPTQ